MKRHNLTLILLTSVIAFLAAAVVIQPVSHVLSSSQQSAPSNLAEEEERLLVGRGFNARLAMTMSGKSIETIESFDKESAEAALNEEARESGEATFAGKERIILGGGLTHAAAGAGTRNTGYGTIRLRGIPAGAQIFRAYLYWGQIQQAPFNGTATFQGSAVTGTLIGSTTEPCWNSSGTFAAYRAVVTSLMQPGINGDYLVSGLPSSSTDGSDPWSPVNTTLPLSEGASLVVIYAHSQIPVGAQFYLFHGADFFAGTLDLTFNFSPVIPSHSTLKHTRLGADGQVGGSLTPWLGITDERTFIGPNLGSLTQIRGSGSGRHLGSDWNGTDGEPLNQLWDTHSDFINGTIPAGVGSYTIRYVSHGDCIIPVAHVLSAY